MSSPGVAQTLADKTSSAGDTAWMLAATVLVLFMALPGFLLLNAGSKSASELFVSGILIFTSVSITTIVWGVYGYSAAFGNGGEFNDFIGSLEYVFLTNLSSDEYIGSIPILLFAIFQLSFAIVTVALLCGAFDRSVNLIVFFAFVILWVTFVYVPIAHWVWGGGFLGKLDFLDFAGGTVVHLSAGVTGLVLIARRGRLAPNVHTQIDNMQMLCLFVGASFLWLGWFGFTAGSALSAGESATVAFATTMFAGAAAALVWFFCENIIYGYLRAPSVLTGALAGLVAITPASGFVPVGAALMIGALAGGICFFASWIVRDVLRYDDRTDLVSVHAVGGALGTILTGVFATKKVGVGSGWIEGNFDQVTLQAAAVAIVAVWSIVVTYVLISFLEGIFQSRPVASGRPVPRT
jgi:Amt family ammonium transporter